MVVVGSGGGVVVVGRGLGLRMELEYWAREIKG